MTAFGQRSSAQAPLTPAQVRARLEASLNATVVASPATSAADGGTTIPGLGYMPAPGHLYLPAPKASIAVAAYIFTR